MAIRVTSKTIARKLPLADLSGLATEAQPNNRMSKDPNSGAILIGADTLDDRYTRLAEVVTETGTSRTLAITDAGNYLRFTNVLGARITIPPQTAVDWAEDAELRIEQASESQVEVLAGSGVTLRNRTGTRRKTAGQFAVLLLKRVAVDEWVLSGEKEEGAEPVPTAVVFDGVDDTATRSGLLTQFAGSFTIEFVLHAFTYAVPRYIFTVDGGRYQIFTVSTNPNSIVVGNTTGWKVFSVGSANADFEGIWRFVYDTSLVGFARHRAFFNGVEIVGTTHATYSAIAVTPGVVMVGSRSNVATTTACKISNLRMWASAVYLGDSEASPVFDLTTVSGATWTDASGNSRDFTLNGGAAADSTEAVTILSPSANAIIQRSIRTEVSFDGTDDHASATLPLSIFTDSITIEFEIHDFTWATGKYFFSVDASKLLIATNSNAIIFGNGTGFRTFTVGITGASYVGVWRVVYDTALAGFNRYRVFKDGLEVAAASTSGTFANFSITTGAALIAARAALSYPDAVMSGFKIWSEAVYPDNAEPDPEVSLDGVSNLLWKDVSGNARDFTLVNGPTSSVVSEPTSTVPVVANYIGWPTAIEAKFGDDDWVTIDDSPTLGAGNVVAELEVTDTVGPLEIRFANTPLVTSSKDAYVGDLYLAFGDSRREGRATSPQIYTGTQPAYVFRQDNAWKVASDPFDTGTASGSPGPLLATLLAARDGIPIGFVWVGQGSQDIAGGNSSFAKPNTNYNLLISQARKAGGRFRAALAMFGPNAAVATIDKATYQAAITQLASDLRADLHEDLVIYWSIHGENASYASNDPVRLAGIAACVAGVVSPGGNLIGPDLTDNVHSKTNLEIAIEATREVLGMSGVPWPLLSTATVPSGGTTITLTFDRDLESTDSTYTASSFEVKDNGVAKTITSVTRTGTRTVAILLSSAISSSTILVSFAKDRTFLSATMPRSVITATPATVNGVTTASQPAATFVDVPVTVS